MLYYAFKKNKFENEKKMQRRPKLPKSRRDNNGGAEPKGAESKFLANLQNE